MKLTIHVRKSPSATGVVQAFCPNVPGCSAVARTEAQAIAILRERIAEQLRADARNAGPGTRVVTIEL